MQYILFKYMQKIIPEVKELTHFSIFIFLGTNKKCVTRFFRVKES